MTIGSWGDIVFEVSGIRSFTFSDVKQKSSGRWSEHFPLNSAPISEFLGPGLDEVELTMILTRMLGIDPRSMYDTVRDHVRAGRNFPLILGGRPLSGNFWYIKDIIGTSSQFEPGTGDILWTELLVSAREYN